MKLFGIAALVAAAGLSVSIENRAAQQTQDDRGKRPECLAKVAMAPDSLLRAVPQTNRNVLTVIQDSAGSGTGIFDVADRGLEKCARQYRWRIE